MIVDRHSKCALSNGVIGFWVYLQQRYAITSLKSVPLTQVKFCWLTATLKISHIVVNGSNVRIELITWCERISDVNFSQNLCHECKLGGREAGREAGRQAGREAGRQGGWQGGHQGLCSDLSWSCLSLP